MKPPPLTYSLMCRRCDHSVAADDPEFVTAWLAEHERSHGTRCVACATTDHTSESHLRRMPYDEARAVLRDMTPCAAHFACVNKITCQKPGADRD